MYGHKLVRFDDLLLPRLNPAEDHGREAEMARYAGLVTTVEPTLRHARIANERLRFSGVVDDAALADAWRARVGTQGRLYRRQASGWVQWIEATLESVVSPTGYLARGLPELTLTFFLRGQQWRGERRGEVWVLDDGSELDAGLMLDDVAESWLVSGGPAGVDSVVNVPNGGNLAVTDGRWRLTAVGSDVTLVRITSGGEALTWQGTLQAGDTLVLDGGRWEALNDGNGALAGVTLPTGRLAWTTVAAGGAAVTVRVTAALATGAHVLVYEGYDGWA